jgi:hypothetical protein
MVLGLLVALLCEATVSRAESFVKNSILKQKTRQPKWPPGNIDTQLINVLFLFFKLSDSYLWLQYIMYFFCNDSFCKVKLFGLLDIRCRSTNFYRICACLCYP